MSSVNEEPDVRTDEGHTGEDQGWNYGNHSRLSRSAEFIHEYDLKILDMNLQNNWRNSTLAERIGEIMVRTSDHNQPFHSYYFITRSMQIRRGRTRRGTRLLPLARGAERNRFSSAKSSRRRSMRCPFWSSDMDMVNDN